MARGRNYFERAAEWATRATGIPEQYIPHTVVLLGIVNQVSGIAAQVVYWGAKSIVETGKIIENRVVIPPTVVDVFSTAALAIIWGDIISLALPALTLFAMKQYFKNDRSLGVSDFLSRSVDGINAAVEMGYL